MCTTTTTTTTTTTMKTKMMNMMMLFFAIFNGTLPVITSIPVLGFGLAAYLIFQNRKKKRHLESLAAEEVELLEDVKDIESRFLCPECYSATSQEKCEEKISVNNNNNDNNSNNNKSNNNKSNNNNNDINDNNNSVISFNDLIAYFAIRGFGGNKKGFDCKCTKSDYDVINNKNNNDNFNNNNDNNNDNNNNNYDVMYTDDDNVDGGLKIIGEVDGKYIYKSDNNHMNANTTENGDDDDDDENYDDDPLEDFAPIGRPRAYVIDHRGNFQKKHFATCESETKKSLKFDRHDDDDDDEESDEANSSNVLIYKRSKKRHTITPKLATTAAATTTETSLTVKTSPPTTTSPTTTKTTIIYDDNNNIISKTIADDNAAIELTLAATAVISATTAATPAATLATKTTDERVKDEDFTEIASNSAKQRKESMKNFMRLSVASQDSAFSMDSVDSEIVTADAATTTTPTCGNHFAVVNTNPLSSMNNLNNIHHHDVIISSSSSNSNNSNNLNSNNQNGNVKNLIFDFKNRRNSTGSFLAKRTSSTATTTNNNNNNKTTSNNNNSNSNSITTRTFDFPSDLCGRLIGKQGRNVGVMKKKSGADICVKPKIYSTEYQTVWVQGTQQQITKAIHLIRKKFTEKKFPNVDYSRCTPDVPLLSPTLVQLSMPVGVPLEVLVTNVVSANHIFLHQVSHPTFTNLRKLTLDMSKCYDLERDVPGLPRPIEIGVVCVVPLYGYWYRCQVVQVYPDADNCDVKLVDYGGYIVVSATTLKQIRSDFMNLPFQAIECYLANVIPLKDDNTFKPEMKEALEKLVGVAGMKAEVVSVESDGVPYVNIEQRTENKVSSINREMVENGYARWIEM
ncbi:hypothetical protein HELRODRAFT_103283 [Helobdella robusta]|uniref:Tudor domain-containing protein n=1 Tax=Helobdella robusta TaxID=6412 RepID=T1EDF3_HELRO|nr:hypothetical protein HELRODRAFT_103283 [Helobdella robusta]ESN93761.1 hypothetical protein HELRODRAFT_103283 [Helobdella robusta]